MKPTLSDSVRFAVQLSCCDERFDAGARAVGLVLGIRLAEGLAAAGPSPTLGHALSRLCEACCAAGFVELEVSALTARDGRIRMIDCTRVVASCSADLGRRVCAVDEGLFEGFLQTALGDPSLGVTETACLGEGQASCEFLVESRDAISAIATLKEHR